MYDVRQNCIKFNGEVQLAEMDHVIHPAYCESMCGREEARNWPDSIRIDKVRSAPCPRNGY